MKKKLYGSMIISLSLIIIFSAIDASAWGGGSRGGASARAGFRGGFYSGFRGGGHYYYPGFYHGYSYGRYGYGPQWPYWYDFAPCIGTFVTYLPDDYTTVIVNGTPYYYAGGYYFTPYSRGYVIVPEPVPAASTTSQAKGAEATAQPSSSSGADQQPVAAQPKSASHDTATINIPNSKGGFTPVVLVKHKDGYTGPQGEFYAGHPTVDELKALYGN